MLACFEASKTPIPTPSFDPCSIEFLPQVSVPTRPPPLCFSPPLPKSPFPVFPFSSRLPPPTSNLFEWHFRPARSLAQSLTRGFSRHVVIDGGLISPSHSFVLLFPSMAKAAAACFVLHVRRLRLRLRRRRRSISPWGKEAKDEERRKRRRGRRVARSLARWPCFHTREALLP